MTTENTEATGGEGLPDEEAVDQIDYEAEALKMGWTPEDRFKGDPKHFIDAKTFYERARTFMPIAKATMDRQSKKIDEMAKALREMSSTISQVKRQGYQQALADLEARQEAAAEAGDVEEVKKISKELVKLESSVKAATDDAADEVDDPIERARMFATWSRENRWYESNRAMAMFADALAESTIKASGKKALSRADLDEIAEQVRAEFPDEFEEAAPKPKPKPRAAVEGVSGSRPVRGGKTYADLPPEAKAACDQFVRMGVFKDRNEFLKDYKW